MTLQAKVLLARQLIRLADGIATRLRENAERQAVIDELRAATDRLERVRNDQA